MHSVFLTHIYTLSLSPTITLSLFFTHNDTLSFSSTHTLCLYFCHTHTLSLSHKHIHSAFLTNTYTLSLSLSPTITLSLSHTHIQSLFLTHTFSLCVFFLVLTFASRVIFRGAENTNFFSANTPVTSTDTPCKWRERFHGMIWSCVTSGDLAWCGVAWRSVVWHGIAWCGVACFGLRYLDDSELWYMRKFECVISHDYICGHACELVYMVGTRVRVCICGGHACELVYMWWARV